MRLKMRLSLLTAILFYIVVFCLGCRCPEKVECKLLEQGIILPQVSTPVAAYVNTVKTERLVYTSGNLPMKQGKIIYAGKVGKDIDLATGQQAAQLCAINALAALKAQIGSLDKINRIIRVEVFVNSAENFTDQSLVANGASTLLVDVFGKTGKHTRMAIGVAELPLNSSVEVAMIIEEKNTIQRILGLIISYQAFGS